MRFVCNGCDKGRCGGIIIKVDIKTGQVLVDNLAELWAQHNSNSNLKEPVFNANPALKVVTKKVHKHLLKRIEKFNKKRYQKWATEELYKLAEMVWIEQQGYKRAAVQLGRSKASCRQMMHHMRKAEVFERRGS